MPSPAMVTIRYVFMVAVSVGLRSTSKRPAGIAAAGRIPYHQGMVTLPGPLVETDWLVANLSEPDLRVFDCTVFRDPAQDPDEHPMRFVSGKDAWRRGHIPGAGFIDLVEELTVKRETRFMFPVPPPERFAEDRLRLRHRRRGARRPLRQYRPELAGARMVAAPRPRLRRRRGPQRRLGEVEVGRADGLDGRLPLPAGAVHGQGPARAHRHAERGARLARCRRDLPGEYAQPGGLRGDSPAPLRAARQDPVERQRSCHHAVRRQDRAPSSRRRASSRGSRRREPSTASASSPTEAAGSPPVRRRSLLRSSASRTSPSTTARCSSGAPTPRCRWRPLLRSAPSGG